MWIEFHHACIFLQEDDAQTQQIANEQSFSDDKGCKPQEGVANGFVFGTQRLQKTNHLSAFKDDNQQAGNHRKAGNGHHQRQDNPYVQVEQVEPREDLRIQFYDRS